MRHLTQAAFWFVTFFSLLFYNPAGAVEDPNKCETPSPRVHAVKLAEPVGANMDLDLSLGGGVGGLAQFDPVPLLETKIRVGGKLPVCVIAHFSAQVSTGDNAVVFQVSIDDVPMEGHTVFPEEIRSPQITNPIVMDKGLILNATTGIPVPTMASYNFFQIVNPGWRIVRVRWASCCTLDKSLLPTVEALAAVLTLEFAK